jgi:hypothetical protein
VKSRPARESVGSLSLLFGTTNSPTTRENLTMSLDSTSTQESELSGSLTARDLLGEARALAGDRAKIKSFTRLFAAPLWGEKDDPIRSKLVPLRWAKLKLKDLLGLMLKEKETSLAALPGTKAFANPMSLKSVQGEGEESSSSEGDVAPKSPSRMRSPLRCCFHFLFCLFSNVISVRNLFLPPLVPTRERLMWCARKRLFPC